MMKSCGTITPSEFGRDIDLIKHHFYIDYYKQAYTHGLYMVLLNHRDQPKYICRSIWKL